jgi:hypothetical protein
MRALLACLFLALPVTAAEPPKLADTFAMKNLVAWCIVPFDSQKRTPKQRVEMLQRLGFTQYAYDWRAEHLPSFPQEIELLKKAKISLKGVWFPANLGKDSEFILEALKKADVKTELWVMLPQPKAESQEEKVKESAKLVTDLAKRAAKQDCKIGIYNHGGWTGEPENMVAIVKACGEPNVGIVYNMHHGHSHLTKLDEYMKLMKPHLYCVNLNGMESKRDAEQLKILIISDGTADGDILAKLSGLQLPFGILGHTNDDAEYRLRDNLTGLMYLIDVTLKPAQKLLPPTFRTPNMHNIQVRYLDGTLEVNPDAMFPPSLDVKPTVVYSLKVFVDKPDMSNYELWDGAPIAGTEEVKDRVIHFTPRFPLEPGLPYRVVLFDLSGNKPIVYYNWLLLPKTAPAKPTTVDAVFPTSAKLPENALRMYLHFSSPMKQGLGYKHIHLTCDGKTVEEPYLHIEQELWSADGKRLTILFDPARVKRGLKPREEAGPILVEGKKHTLTIDAAWPDANGFPLKEKFTYSFDVGPPDETAIDPEKWTITPPTSESQLVVKFEKPLDKALSERLIWVVDAEGKRLELPSLAAAGQTGVTIGAATTKWKPGNYKLVIDTRLEDICGNRVGEPFEVDEFKPVTKVVAGKTVERTFTVK